jgi:hypothetical protein
MIEQKFRWDEERVRQNEAFKEILDRTSVREQFFNEKFLEGLEKRRDGLDQRDRNAQLVQWTVLLMLGISIFAVNVPISLFGMSTSNASNLREILLLITASVPLYGLYAAVERTQITDAMNLYVQKIAGDDATVLRIMNLRYGLALSFKMPELVDRKLTKVQRFNLISYAVGFVCWMLITIGTLFLVELMAVISILHQPTVSMGFSIFIVLYVIVANAANFGFRAVMGLGTNARTPSLVGNIAER